MYSRQLCLLRVVQAAVVDALFCYVLYAMCMFYVWTDMFKYIIFSIGVGFLLFLS
jgi:hypothetical protein